MKKPRSTNRHVTSSEQNSDSVTVRVEQPQQIVENSPQNSAPQSAVQQTVERQTAEQSVETTPQSPIQQTVESTSQQIVESAPQQSVESSPQQSEQPKKAKPKKSDRRIIKSVSQRTTVNYILFSLIILIALWSLFFIFIDGMYMGLVESDVISVRQSAAVAFPKTLDERSMGLYRARLIDIARDNKPVAIAVFDVDETGKAKVLTLVDDMGNGSSQNNEFFDSVIGGINFYDLCSSDSVITVDTHFGKHLCCGSRFFDEENSKYTYLLIVKQYDVYRNQVNKLMSLLIICTVIVVVFSVVFAYFASRFQTKQLTDFSRQAKRLANGEEGVVFSGGGYEEFDNLARALNSAMDTMQRAEKLQRDFVANVSHDFRTPLTMIKGYAEMLRDMPVDEQKRRKTANIIISEADRLTALSNDLLDYSRLQAGVIEFKIEKCSLSQIAEGIIQHFEIMREHDGIDLQSEIESGITVSCDKQKIAQVIYNLLNNAINYRGADQTVILAVKRVGSCARVEVTDHGVGIPPEEIDSVWERYYRAAHSKRQAVGSGIGLSICKSILTHHNARYGVISEVGKGSTFWFELDIAAAQ